MVSGAPMTSLLPVVIGKPSGENHSLKKKSASGPGKTIVSINGPRDPIKLAHQIVLESNGQCYERRNAWRSGQEGWVWWPKAKMNMGQLPDSNLVYVPASDGSDAILLNVGFIRYRP